MKIASTLICILHLKYIICLLIAILLKCDLTVSSLSESESQETLTLSSREVTGATGTDNPHILLNVKHLTDFIQSMKKSQDAMFQKIEKLANAVEFTDRQGEILSRGRLNRKLSGLENRVLDLERALHTKVEMLVQQAIQMFDSGKPEHAFRNYDEPVKITTTTPLPPPQLRLPYNRPPTSRIITESPTVPPPQLMSFFQIEQPFTPPPLFPVRSSRDASSTFLFGNGGGTIGNNMRGYSSFPTLKDPHLRGNAYQHDRFGQMQARDRILSGGELETRGLNSNQVVPPEVTTVAVEHEKNERQLKGVTTTTDSYLMRRITQLERSFAEIRDNISLSFHGQSSYRPYAIQNSASTEEITDLKEKQGQLQRAVDTVLVHFSGIFRSLEKIEERIEQCRIDDTTVSNSQNHAGSTAYYDEDVIPTLTTTTSIPSPTTQPSYWDQTTGTSRSDYDEVTTYSSNHFGDYGRFPETNEGEEWGDGDGNSYTRPSSSNDNWLDNISVERNEPDPEPVDFATYAFLRTPSKKMLTKSLHREGGGVQSDESGRMRVARDLSFLTKTVQNLTEQLGHQKNQIDQLSSEVSKVNVSHVLLLRAMDDATLKRTIRPKDCSEIQLLLEIASNKNTTGTRTKTLENTTGTFTIFPKQNDESVQVICDLSDGGGWTVIQHRGTPHKKVGERTNFYQNWSLYEQGFGSVDEDYWLGLSNIAALTKLDDQEVRIELTKWDGSREGIATYKHFRLGDNSTSYRLHVSNYSGDAGDSLSRHDGMSFSTYDQDHDTDPQRNCAQMWQGAWWYYGCYESNLNGLYATNENGSHDFGTGIVWTTYTGNYYSLKKVVIKIRNRYGSSKS